jgi:ATP-binding cassette subfamily F protein 3
MSYKPNEGSAEFVGANVFPAYFEQNQADVLDLTKSVIETVQAASVNQSYNELRALLGQFLFKGDSVEKKVENLSGGEKARLSLCCMMLRVRHTFAVALIKANQFSQTASLCFNRNPTS